MPPSGKTTATFRRTSQQQQHEMLLTRALRKLHPHDTTRVAVRVYLIRHGRTHWNQQGKIQGGGYDVPLNAEGRVQAKQVANALKGIPLDALASSSLARANETANIVWEYYTTTKTSQENDSNNDETENLPRIVHEGFNEMRFGKFEGFAYRSIAHRNRDNRQQQPRDVTEKGDTSKSEAKLVYFLREKKLVSEDPEHRFPSRDRDNDDDDHWNVDPRDEIYRTDTNFGEGESTRMVEDRALEALSQIIEKVLHNNETIAATTTDATKHVAIVSHGRTNKVLIQAMTGPNFSGEIKQGNANISVLDHPGLGTGREQSSDGASTGNEPPLPSSWKEGWHVKLLNYTDHIGDR